VASGLLGVVFGLVRANDAGWTSVQTAATIGAGVLLLGAFLLWERRAAQSMVDLSLFRSRTFSVTNALGFVMFFGTFGSIFLLTQVLQYAMGSSPLDAGVKMLAWTGATMLVAPIAGATAERVGPRAYLTAGLALQGAALLWMAQVTEVGLGYGAVVIPFVMAGAGMAMCFAPSTSAVLSAVRPDQAGQASGIANAVRELGGVFGVAVLASVFAAHGTYASPQAFVDGALPAVTVGGIVVLAGALLALAALPARRRRPAPARSGQRSWRSAARGSTVAP
jgi:MFS family permease